jgi:hypothetical protein
VVDLVVGRYADRLRYMGELVDELEVMQGEVNALLNTHIDYGVEDEGYQAAIGRCGKFYTSSVAPETPEDRLIFVAIETVTLSICSTLFELRKLVVEGSDPNDVSLGLAKQTLRCLMDKLRWTRWKECLGCGFDEVCFVPMWPFGDKDSHERPNCRNESTIKHGWRENSYWDWPGLSHEMGHRRGEDEGGPQDLRPQPDGKP